MASELQTIERGRDMALRIIEDLPFIVGLEAITESRKRMALAFGAGSPQLFECSEESIGYAIALSAMSGLYPGGPRPDVWLIPRKNRRKKGEPTEANWQIASRGYQRLARRANYDVTAHIVHKHDVFEYEESEPRMVHRPNVDKEGTWETIKLGYVKIESDAEGIKYRLLRKDQIEKRRKCAQDDSFWTKWPEEKTLATLYNYAGAREAWPTDEQSRYAMATSERMESGDLVTLHESGGRPLLEADIASESPATADQEITDEQSKELAAACKARGVSFRTVFGMMGREVPDRVGAILSSDYDDVEAAIVKAGIENGGCEKCGNTTSEKRFCSPECEAFSKEKENAG